MWEEFLEKKGSSESGAVAADPKNTLFSEVSFRNRSGRNAVKGDILCCDFMLVESIAVFNAVATAEGARCWKRCGIRIPIYTKAKALSSVMADAEKY